MADRTLNRTRLRDLRESTPLTQKELALRANVAERTVKHAESGAHAPSGIVLHKLAKALGVEVSELLVGQEQTEDAA